MASSSSNQVVSTKISLPVIFFDGIRQDRMDNIEFSPFFMDLSKMQVEIGFLVKRKPKSLLIYVEEFDPSSNSRRRTQVTEEGFMFLVGKTTDNCSLYVLEKPEITKKNRNEDGVPDDAGLNVHGIVRIQSFIRGVKARKEYCFLLERHRSAVIIQKFMKGRIVRKRYLEVHNASVMIQSVVRGWLFRRGSVDVALKQFCLNEEPQVNSMYLAKLQLSFLRAKTSLRESERGGVEKDEEIENLRQQLQQCKLQLNSMEERVLYGPSQRKRLPVFEEICPSEEGEGFVVDS